MSRAVAVRTLAQECLLRSGAVLEEMVVRFGAIASDSCI